MLPIPKRRIVIRYGNIPIERIIASAKAAAGGNAVIGKQERNGTVGLFCGADHTAAFQTAELDGLEIDNAEDLFTD